MWSGSDGTRHELVLNVSGNNRGFSAPPKRLGLTEPRQARNAHDPEALRLYCSTSLPGSPE